MKLALLVLCSIALQVASGEEHCEPLERRHCPRCPGKPESEVMCVKWSPEKLNCGCQSAVMTDTINNGKELCLLWEMDSCPKCGIYKSHMCKKENGKIQCGCPTKTMENEEFKKRVEKCAKEQKWPCA